MSVDRRRRSWTAAARERAVGALPPEKLLPDSQPAYMSSWIYVFGVLTLASLVRDHRLGLDPRLEGAGLVALHRHRALLQQHPPVVGGAVLLLHGHPPVGQVLDGGVAGRPRAGLDDRRGRVPGRGPVCADRLRLAAELRRAVDLDAGQGRAERGRGRRVLQRHELRPDVQLPRPPAAARGRRDRGRPRPARAQARDRAAVPAVRARDSRRPSRQLGERRVGPEQRTPGSRPGGGVAS